MDKLNFYRQKRRDGGLRTGIDINGERVLENYEAGDSPPDSALLWFVDVRCSGENLPAEPEAIRRWFLERSEPICAALRGLADELRVGIDSDWPLKRDVPSQGETRVAIFCSAVRRLGGLEISEMLSNLAAQWPATISGLGSFSHPVSAHG